MIRKLKTFGVALCAVLALTAIAASAASAEKQYTASGYPTTGTGVSLFGNDTFVTEAAVVECKAHFEGTLTAPSSTLTVTPKYSECKFGAFVAHVEMRSCDYLFETPKLIAPGEHTASVQVKCGSEPILIKVGNTATPVCEITVGEQTPANHVISKDTGAGDVTVQATVTEIAYNVIKDNFGCPFLGTGVRSGAKGATYLQHNPVTVDSTSTTTIDIG